jgi:hypothetical protein
MLLARLRAGLLESSIEGLERGVGRGVGRRERGSTGCKRPVIQAIELASIDSEDFDLDVLD